MVMSLPVRAPVEPRLASRAYPSPPPTCEASLHWPQLKILLLGDVAQEQLRLHMPKAGASRKWCVSKAGSAPLCHQPLRSLRSLRSLRALVHQYQVLPVRKFHRRRRLQLAAMEFTRQVLRLALRASVRILRETLLVQLERLRLHQQLRPKQLNQRKRRR